MRNSILFLISKAQHNFGNELFDSVETQCNSTIVKRHFFCAKLKWNLISAIEISRHNSNTAFFAIWDRKRVSNLLKKADIYQH